MVITDDKFASLVEKINRLKKEKNAVVLVHCYQRPAIYDIADFIGDSFDLSQKAAQTEAEIIVFCGVHFMAESAAILNQRKKVILPAADAGCPMAATASAEEVREARRNNPGAAIVSYMNTTAEVKAESDIICTSSNAIKIVNSLLQSRVVFIPDRNLGKHVAKHSAKEIVLWKGHCYVHTKFLAAELSKAKKEIPGAKVVVHPECEPEIRNLADHICSTSGMIPYCSNSDASEFIIGTESGMIELLKRRVPGKKFYAAPPGSTCITMKKNTLELVLDALQAEKPVVTVPKEIAARAKKALDRMLEIGK